MTASSAVDHAPHRHPLAPGAGADAIRRHLLAEDRPLFDAELLDARGETAVTELLERWRGVAMVQRDRDVFVRTARRVAERVTGTPSPADEPLAVTRAKAGM